MVCFELHNKYWDCCALVTDDGKLNTASFAQIYRDRGDCENNRAWELIILAAFRKWLGWNRAKGLLPEPLAMIG